MNLSAVFLATAKLLVLLACFALGSLLAWGGEPRAQLRLRERCEVAGPTIRLGDVAELAAVDDATAAKWNAIRLGPAPRPGQQSVLTAREVQDVLELNGLSIERVHLFGAREVRIAAPAAVPVAPPPATAPRKPAAANPPTASAASPEGHVRSVVYLARPVARGAILQETDLAVRQVDAATAAGEVLSDPRQAVGWEATRGLFPNQPLSPSALRRPILVQRNEVVKLVARSAGVRVTVDAKALGEASLGDLVEVQPLESRERLTARVTGRQTVEIYARGATVPAEPATAYPVQPAANVGGQR